MTSLNHLAIEESILSIVLRGTYIGKPPKVLLKGHGHYGYLNVDNVRKHTT